MPGPDPLSLEQRVARLERLVARLLEQEESAPKDEATEPRRPTDEPFAWARPAEEPQPATAEGPASAAPPEPEGLAGLGERWLGRIGVIFVVLAFGFLLKYAFDQGWIGPAFRLTLGFVAATVMLVIGLRLEASRERYSQYLLGGAVAVYYLVGFASYELYELVPFALAFAFMCAVTVLSFVLAERQRLASLAVIGAAGGLATPFLIDNGSGNVPALVLYTTLLLAGAGAIQFLRGWRLLLFVLGFGGLGVMALAVDGVEGRSAPLEQAMVAIGILTAWAVFGALPLLRAHLQGLDPDAWPEPLLPRWTKQVASPGHIAGALLRIACVSAALLAVVELGWLLEAERESFGVLLAIAAAVHLGLGLGLARTRPAVDVAAETASVLMALAVAFFFADYRMVLPLAVLAAGMHLAHERWSLSGVAALAHAVFGVALILVIVRVDLPGADVTPFGAREIGALGAIVLAVTTTFVLRTAKEKQAYWIASHIAFLVWLATQFTPMRYGQELISLSWGVYGIVLLLVALRVEKKGMQVAGLVTLGIVAAKLLLVDMAQVGVIWRILLFMGFGAAFLGLSYLINRGAKSD
jgi:uncharacterized membrane protein